MVLQCCSNEKTFPEFEKDKDIHIDENHMNQHVLLRFTVKGIAITITNDEHGMAPSILSYIMENLSKDVLFLLTLHLDLPDILSLCDASERINNLVSKRDEIWNAKLQQEFLSYQTLKPNIFRGF